MSDTTRTPGEQHVCESCADCLHDGNKCCGCYDGACCKSDTEKRAWDELARLTSGAGPAANWRWSIPARPDRDSDLLLAAGLQEVADERDRLAATIEAVKALHPFYLFRPRPEDTGGTLALRQADVLRILSRTDTTEGRVKNPPEVSHVTPTSEVSLHADTVRAIKAEALREAAEVADTIADSGRVFTVYYAFAQWLRARATLTQAGEGQ